MTEGPSRAIRFDPRGTLALVMTLAALLALFYWRLPSLGALQEYPELRAREPVKALLQDSLLAHGTVNTPGPFPAEWGCELCNRAGVRSAWDRLELLVEYYGGQPPFLPRAVEALPRARAISLATWGDAASLEIVPNPKQTVQALAANPSDPLFGVQLISPGRISALGWSWNVIDWVTGVLAVVLILRLHRARPEARASPFGAGEAASVFIWTFGAGAACYAALDFPDWLADWYPAADLAMAAVVLALVWQGRPWSTLARGLGLTWCGTWKLITYSLIVFGVFALFAWIIETPLMALGQVSPWPQDSGDLLLYGSAHDKLVRIVSLVITGPFFEELMFTGLLFGGLMTRLSFRIAALITASLFAAEHAVDIVSSADLLVGSVASCWAFWKTGSIWPPVLAHAAFNAMCASVVLY